MKILVISQYFYPENFRINDLALELKNRGHEITVLTGKPNYPQGKYFQGYTFKGNEDEQWNGITIKRVPLRARKQGAINLIRNYISFVYHANKKIKEFKMHQFDLIYVFEVSPITVALPAIRLKKRVNIPIIMNVQDLWPENIIAVTGINNQIINYILNKLVNYIYKNIDTILTASPAFIDKIEPRVKNRDTIKYWPQYSVVSKSENIDNTIYDYKKFNIVFAGNIGEAQGLEIIIDAAETMKDTNIVFHIVGDGRNKKKLQKLCHSKGLEDTILFYGQIPEKDIPNYLEEADTALLILKPDSIFDMTIPAKLQTYMACGCMITGCVQGVTKDIIQESQSGIVTDDVSAIALKETCLKLLELDKQQLNAYKNNSLQYSNDFFCKNKLIDQLEKYMEELLNETI